MDRCAIPGCRADAELTYVGHGVCTPHWNEHTAETLRMVLGLETDEENDMRKKTMPPRKTENSAMLAAAKAPVTTTPATAPEPELDAPTAEQGAPVTATDVEETPAAEETAVPAPKKKTREKKAAAPKAVAPAPTPTPKAPKEPLVVFACRVAEPERVKFHEATGPAGATRFARKLMVVFSNEDEAGFRALLKEAREARQ